MWAVLVVGGVVAAETYLGVTEKRLVESAGRRVQSSAEAIEQVMLRTIEAVEALHSLVQARQDLLERGNAAGAQTIADYLTEAARREKFGILQVATTAHDGMLNWSTVPGWQPVALADREHIRVHFSGPPQLFVSAPLVGRASGRWSVQLSRPVIGRDGTFAGVSVVSLDPVQLSDSLSEVHDSAYEVSVVLRLPDSALLARSRDITRQLGRIAAAPHPAVAAALLAPTGHLRTKSPVDGREIVLGYRRMAVAPLVVTVVEDWDHAAVELRVLRRWVRVALAVGLLLALVAMLLALQARATRQARRALAVSEAAADATRAAWAELDRLLSASPSALYSGEIDASGGGADPVRIRFISPNIERVTGWSAEALRSPGAIAARMDPADAAGRPGFRRAAALEGAASSEYRLRDPDGRWRWIREDSRVVGPTAGGPIEIVCYLTDITEQRRIQAQAAAASRLASLGEMAANMAHELNQPLAVMSLAAENAAASLEDEGPDGIPEAQEALELVADQAVRCRTIVQHLRQFSRPDRPQVLEPVCLDRALDGALVLVRGALEQASIELRRELPRDLPPVLADRIGVEQIFVNLLLNARDALLSRPGRSPHLIRMTATAGDGLVTVAVADTGGGIPAEVLERVFEPFFTTKGAERGTGLGLSICHAMMRSFEGHISAGNTPDGARILLTFRMAPAAGCVQPAISA